MKWALITGASSGLGKEFAWQLAAEPLNVVLVARRKERLEQLAGKIRETLGVQVEVLDADLSKKSGQQTVIQRLHDNTKPVSVLVNNAGFGLGQSFIDGNWKREDQALEVMGRALARLSYEAANAMRRRAKLLSPPRRIAGLTLDKGKFRDGGVIINVSSATAYTAMGSYASIKTWVRFFSESLATQLTGTGVSVTVTCPGLMKTEFHESAKMDASAWPEIGFIKKETVVRETIEAARKRRTLVTPTLMYRGLMFGARLCPRWLMRELFGSHLMTRTL